MEVVTITNEEQPPRRIVGCTGASFCLIRLVETDYPGHLEETICYLLDVLIVNVASDYSGNYTDDKRRKDSYHDSHLLPNWFNAVIFGSGSIGGIIPERIQQFNTTD